MRERILPHTKNKFIGRSDLKNSPHLAANVARASALRGEAAGLTTHGSYLVDPASSHMLVSKIKPCMSKYKYCTAKLQTAH